MDSHYLLLVLATLLVSFSSLSAASNVDGSATPPANSIPTKLVNEFCNHKGTGMKTAFCLDVLNSDPRTASASNYFTLFNITMEKAVSDVTKIRNYFSNMRKLQPQLNRTLTFCVTRYDAVLKALEIAVTRVAGGKFDADTLSFDVAMTYDYASQSGERLDADGIRDKFLQRMSEVVMDYSMVCYAIALAVAEKLPR